MPRARYIALDPISSSPVLLNNPSGSPALFCHALSVSHPQEERTIRIAVGCNSGSSRTLLLRRTVISVRLQVEAYTPDDVDAFLGSLRTAIQGDQSVPRQDEAGTFRFVMRQDGGTNYGFKFCTAESIDWDDTVQEADGRLLYPDGIPFPEVRMTVRSTNATEESWT